MTSPRPPSRSGVWTEQPPSRRRTSTPMSVDARSTCLAVDQRISAPAGGCFHDAEVQAAAYEIRIGVKPEVRFTTADGMVGRFANRIRSPPSGTARFDTHRCLAESSIRNSLPEAARSRSPPERTAELHLISFSQTPHQCLMAWLSRPMGDRLAGCRRWAPALCRDRSQSRSGRDSLAVRTLRPPPGCSR